MKNKIIYSILTLAFAFVGSSCSEYDMLSYKNDPALHFFNKSGVQQDSINHSFFFLSQTQEEDEVRVVISTIGELSDIDRPIPIIQINAGKEGAAEAGVHYVSFDDPRVKERMVVPASKNRVEIPIIILKDPSLDNGIVRLELGFGENEYFKAGVVADNLDVFTIKTTTQATKPSIWDSRGGFYWAFSFGSSWNTTKMRFLVDVTGLTDWETSPSEMAYIAYLENMVKTAFVKYREENGPLKEPDGTIVEFKPGW